MESLWLKLVEAFDWLILRITLIVETIFNTVWDMLKDFLIYCVDALLELGISILNGLALSFDWNPSEYINGLPSDVTNVLGLVGLGEATVIITGAILVRLVLQLIPFTRLGS